MAKVQIEGKVYDFDSSRKPISEAIAIEDGLGCRYGDWEADIAAGSARAMCAFIWLVWRRNGRDVSLADMLAGKVDVDLADLKIESGEPAAAGADPPPAPPEGGSPEGAPPARPKAAPRARR